MEEQIQIHVVKIFDTFCSINEGLFREDAENIRYNVDHKMGFNRDNNWVNLTVRVTYLYPDKMEEVVMDIAVETVFYIENLKGYVNIQDGPVMANDMNLPSSVLIKLADMSISHTRALLAKNKAASVFHSINIPYINPVESAKKFFGNKIEGQG